MARSRRVSGFLSKATWQMRSNGSRFLPNSSPIVCLRPAAYLAMCSLRRRRLRAIQTVLFCVLASMKNMSLIHLHGQAKFLTPSN